MVHNIGGNQMRVPIQLMPGKLRTMGGVMDKDLLVEVFADQNLTKKTYLNKMCIMAFTPCTLTKVEAIDDGHCLESKEVPGYQLMTTGGWTFFTESTDFAKEKITKTEEQTDGKENNSLEVGQS